MKTHARILVFLFSCSFTVLCQGQDRIIKKDSTEISCMVRTADSVRIHYNRPGYSVSLVFYLSTDEAAKIIYADGSMKKNLLKSELFSPLVNVLSLCYEGCYKPGKTVEVTLGIIGASPNGLVEEYALADPDDDGVILRLGHKWFFFQTGSSWSPRMKPSYFDGIYLRLDAAFASYSTWAHRYSKAALLVNPGYQFVINDLFVMDCWAGLGIGTGGDLEWDYPYGFWSIGYAFSFGFRVGFVIG